MKITPETMRKRYHLATAEAEAIRAKSAPLRAERDALYQGIEARVRELNAAIRALEAPLGELDKERGTIAKALREEDGKSRLGQADEYCSPTELEAARKV